MDNAKREAIENALSRRSFITGVGAAALGVAGAGMLASCAPGGNGEAPEKTGDGSAEPAASDAAAKTSPYDGFELYEFVTADETVEADVVVIGSGTGGLVPAINLAEEGYSVVLLEKMSMWGGNTNFAEGCFGVGTEMQKEQGIEFDWHELLLQELNFQNFNSNPKIWELYIKHSAEDFKWFTDHGVKFEGVFGPGGGAETWHLFEGHHGDSAVAAMIPAAEAAGVDLRQEVKALGLLMEDGVCVGVQAQDKRGSIIDFKAKETIVATGGTSENHDGLMQTTNRNIDRTSYQGGTGHDGDGLGMVAQALAETPKDVMMALIGSTIAGARISSHLGLAAGCEPKVLWVNHNAERFIDETMSALQLTAVNNALLTQSDAFAIMDQALWTSLETEGVTFGLGAYLTAGEPATKMQEQWDALEPEGNCFKADTIEDLAEQMGVDPAMLRQTIDTYNGYCDAGSDEDYRKDPAYLIPCETPPFYGFRLAALHINTMGGIRIDQDCHVINKNYEVIEGLWASGVDCSGFAGETYGIVLPGSNQGVALFTGRQCARAILDKNA